MEAEAFGRRLRPLDPPIAGGQGAHDVRSLDLLQSLKLCRFRRRRAGRGEPAVELQRAPAPRRAPENRARSAMFRPVQVL